MTSPNIDPRIAKPEDCVLRPLLDRRAAETPDKVYAIFQDDSSWTYAEMKAEVVRTAIGLQQLGVKQGDHVVSWLPNGPVVVKLPNGLLPREELMLGSAGRRANGSPRFPVELLFALPGWRDCGQTCSRFQVTPESQFEETEARL